jgi:hypothetical protein
VFSALQFTRSAFESTTQTWVPVGNDSFYHARRILDAAENPEGLTQFDTSMHVPEGSWINWPWAYDWSMAKGLQLWQSAFPDADAMKFLAHVPAYWVFINMALLLGICISLGLAVPWIFLVLLGYALSPLTMLLHGVGIIDHHYIEHSFVLLTALTGLRWLNRPDELSHAVLLGVVLGAAPAFHTGLFILQLPVLVTLGILWLRGLTPPRTAMLVFAGTLLFTTLLAATPSDAFRAGQFLFPVLSWFHVYIALVTTLLTAGLGFTRFSTVSLAGFSFVSLLLLAPIWADALGGAAFLSGDIVLLDRIAEVKSPFAMLMQPGKRMEAINYYSLLGLLAPLLFLIYLRRCWQATSPRNIFFAVFAVFALALLAAQFRLHYFGSFMLLLGWAVLLNDKTDLALRKPALVMAAGAVIIIGSCYTGISNKLFVRYALGLDPAYEDTFVLFADLERACAANPGIAFADNNFGHYIRYHTDCSVIANNFLMTPQHEEKIRAMHELLKLSPEQFLQAAPTDTKYVFARLENFFIVEQGEIVLGNREFLQNNNPRLFVELSTRSDLPARFRILNELPLDDAAGTARARVLEILPPD